MKFTEGNFRLINSFMQKDITGEAAHPTCAYLAEKNVGIAENKRDILDLLVYCKKN